MYGTKFSEYKPKECRYCYFWCGQNKRCFLDKENCYYETVEVAAEKNECDGCPYGRYSPCIGWCTKKVLGKGGGGNDGI